MKGLLVSAVASAALAACAGDAGVPASPQGFEASGASQGQSVGGSGGGSGSTAQAASPSGSQSGSTTSVSTGASTAGGTAAASTGSTAPAPLDAAPPPPLPAVPDGGTAGLPCDVSQLLQSRCQSCHSQPPVAPSPMALVTYANLVTPSLADKTKTYAEESVVRMQNVNIPMPPLPAAAATPAEVAILQGWIRAGYPTGTCGLVPADAGPDAALVGANPYATPTICTSKVSWTVGNNHSMRPGEACIACHSRGEGPAYSIAGTLYPTAHEPNDCNGVNATLAGATVVITDANGMTLTLTPDGVGNFSSSAAVALPFHAKVVQRGKERVMTSAQTSGDCNSCHTLAGANMAPGRIMLP